MNYAALRTGAAHPLPDFSRTRSNDDPEMFFSTSHVIPHIRALVPCPGLTSEVSVVASTSVSLTPTEILFFCRVPDRNTVFL